MVKANVETPEVYLKALEIALQSKICREVPWESCSEGICGTKKCIGWHIAAARKELGIK
jgi:hypothetical protein